MICKANIFLDFFSPLSKRLKFQDLHKNMLIIHKLILISIEAQKRILLTQFYRFQKANLRKSELKISGELSRSRSVEFPKRYFFFLLRFDPIMIYNNFIDGVCQYTLIFYSQS